MKLKDERDTYGSYSATAADKETGEKVLVDSVSHFDLTCSNVYNDTLSVAKFLDPTAIRLIVSMFSNLNTTAFRNFLVNFSDKAVRDHKAKTSMSTLEKDGKVYLTGAEILITELIQKSYRYCIQNRVDVNKPVQVLKTMKDAFSASRVLDEGIVQLRDSVALQVVTLQKSVRDAFVSSLRIGFMLYILLLSFKYLK